MSYQKTETGQRINSWDTAHVAEAMSDDKNRCDRRLKIIIRKISKKASTIASVKALVKTTAIAPR